MRPSAQSGWIIVSMRRVALVAALMCAGGLGVGTALVMASSKQGSPGSGHVPVCHSGNGKYFVHIAPDASGVLSGHAHHPHDIIPPFELIEPNGTTTHYPGKNLETIYAGGYTGAEILDNHCVIPSGGRGVTEATVVTETMPEPVVVTEPARVVTVPGETTRKELTVTETVPGETDTVPGATTVVTVPAGQATTVTLPAQTVTLPATALTVAGEVIVRDPETVTLPGTTTTVVADGTPTVVTVTAPNATFEHPGLSATKVVTDAVTEPARAATLAARVVHVRSKGKVVVKTVTVLVVRSRPCPPGTRLAKGACRAIVRGKG